MNPTVSIILSAFTAFVITAGGSTGIAFIATSGAMPSKAVWVSTISLGLVAAAKDIRAQLKLPPLSTGTGNTDIITKP